MLAIEGPRYCGEVEVEIGGRVLRVRSQPGIPGTAGNIWDASVLLAEYLATIEISRYSTIVELGAGLGLCSVAAKLFGAPHVLATDLESALPGIRTTAALNNVEIDIETLDWTQPRFVEADLILLSDVVWVEELIQPLVNTLKMMITRENRAIMCYKLRSNVIHAKFEQALSASGLHPSPVSSPRDHLILQITHIP